ncbi:MAG: hypothetical protein HY737_08560 [Candidatus Omnitrophica bacterium]|nr:hypothetical protein [Candidatus Omnitrophota bacterium]
MKPARVVCLMAAWVCASLAVIGFFLPWARIDLREPSTVKRLRETVPLQGTMEGLAGAMRGITKDVGRVAVTIRRGAETVTGDITVPSLEDIPRVISGAQIPQMANSQHAQLAVAIMEMLTGKRQQVGLQSAAVYLLPGIAVGCAALLTWLPRPWWLPYAVSGLCATLAAAGFWKLSTTNTAGLLIAVTVGPGLWLSLWAYVALAVCAAALGVTRIHR